LRIPAGARLRAHGENADQAAPSGAQSWLRFSPRKLAVFSGDRDRTDENELPGPYPAALQGQCRGAGIKPTAFPEGPGRRFPWLLRALDGIPGPIPATAPWVGAVTQPFRDVMARTRHQTARMSYALLKRSCPRDRAPRSDAPPWTSDDGRHLGFHFGHALTTLIRHKWAWGRQLADKTHLGWLVIAPKHSPVRVAHGQSRSSRRALDRFSRIRRF
jgi:hypothetical protein